MRTLIKTDGIACSGGDCVRGKEALHSLWVSWFKWLKLPDCFLKRRAAMKLSKKRKYCLTKRKQNGIIIELSERQLPVPRKLNNVKTNYNTLDNLWIV